MVTNEEKIKFYDYLIKSKAYVLFRDKQSFIDIDNHVAGLFTANSEIPIICYNLEIVQELDEKLYN